MLLFAVCCVLCVVGCLLLMRVGGRCCLSFLVHCSLLVFGCWLFVVVVCGLLFVVGCGCVLFLVRCLWFVGCLLFGVWGLAVRCFMLFVG